MKPANQNLEVLPPQGGEKAVDIARPPVPTFDIEGVFRYALEQKAGPEAMTTLMNIRRELNAEAAKKAFDEALSAFQLECPIILKTKSVATNSGQEAYRYAPIENIEVVIRPIERKYGFTHTFDTDVASQPEYVIAKCIVTHTAGHVRETSIKLPIGTKTGIMSNTQVHASALTFANRRALTNAYGLVVAGEDRDGAAKTRPMSPGAAAKAGDQSQDEAKALAKELWELLKPVVGKDPKWNSKNWDGHNQWLWREEVLDGGIPEAMPNLSADRIRKAIESTRKKI